MTKIFLFIVALFISGCGGGGNMLPKMMPVVALYGDSITSGTHSEKYDEWIPTQWAVSPAQYIASIAGVRYFDYSENGANAADASIKPDNSDIVVIRFGVADAYHGTLPADFSTQITRLVGEARAMRKLVILSGLPKNAFNNTGALDVVMRERATALGVPFVDVFSLDYSIADLADPLHPGENYSQRIGLMVAKKILEEIK